MNRYDDRAQSHAQQTANTDRPADNVGGLMTDDKKVHGNT